MKTMEPHRRKLIEVALPLEAINKAAARNEILHSLNKPEDFVLAIVEFLPEGAHKVHYVRRPFKREPDFGVTSVNYGFAELLALSEKPS